ncbi:sulfite exporter TauE/SafE family protein [Campylobacter sp. RM9344]|uniref:Probable membrane transporter protein n=1 Tax=Campylobacter californiensis TaxID=1032243 RepID=A0AAW3ZXJ8_9BACT|nr:MULTISPECIES: sulfite exporter TauE/SafE family protein [unclassified Campylobacter]MBE2984167.1 sulfite exporter TauE/SafE family protein [Campylobacter sp. RM6883]MBE2995536.1 sulfite exporter TauE/SafE family protein [Campylobacter sp. RM6913]MBE3029795.1 sulfite exporter TauE/SafE family protein [Campylobacter sp. RM9344]MBE3605931.1 sulfite exporter TauE/SafE family protein [Campylobacter sp. RM13119]MBE3607780.1 sulfite exporter TauE/SafE family protein [Campylobacter sp. RM9337]
MLFALLLIVGTFVGFISGFFGIGGGTIIVPIMLALGYNIKTAIGISITQMLMGAIFGSYMNYKAGLLRLNKGIYLGLGGMSGASLSGYIVELAPEILLESILLATFAFSIFRLYFTTVSENSSPNTSNLLLFLVGFSVGAIAISIGIGGAVFITPILVGFLGYEMKKAISMGVFFVMFASISGFISMAYHGHVEYAEGFTLGIGALLGVYFGTKTTHKTDKKVLKKWFLLLYLVMSSLMIKKIFFS